MVTATKTKAAAEAIGAGALSPNEARFKYFGLGKVEGGDTPYMQQQNFSLAALAEARRRRSVREAGRPRPRRAGGARRRSDDEAEEKQFLDTLDKALRGALLCGLTCSRTHLAATHSRACSIRWRSGSPRSRRPAGVGGRLGDVRDRLASVEARAPIPGPAGPPGPPGPGRARRQGRRAGHAGPPVSRRACGRARPTTWATW